MCSLVPGLHGTIFHQVVPSLTIFLSLCAVHGFASASYEVTEDANLATTFSLNVKGQTTLLGAVTGEITSRAGGTSRKLVLHDLHTFY